MKRPLILLSLTTLSCFSAEKDNISNHERSCMAQLTRRTLEAEETAEDNQEDSSPASLMVPSPVRAYRVRRQLTAFDELSSPIPIPHEVDTHNPEATRREIELLRERMDYLDHEINEMTRYINTLNYLLAELIATKQGRD